MHAASPTVPADRNQLLRPYEELLAPARQRFRAQSGVVGITAASTSARRMAAFLVHFSARSVAITEPVEDWLRRAATRCGAMGMEDLERALTSHARAESGHHRYHENDLVAMVAFWNARYRPLVELAQMGAMSMGPAGSRYCALHEANIRGETPFCQLAIEYEIELLPVQIGPAFVSNCVRLLGQSILECMTFVTSHIQFDVGHTQFNAHFLAKLLAQDAGRLSSLSAAGAAALDAFGDHLTECWLAAAEME